MTGLTGFIQGNKEKPQRHGEKHRKKPRITQMKRINTDNFKYRATTGGCPYEKNDSEP